MFKRLVAMVLLLFLILSLFPLAAFADNRDLIVYYAVGSKSAYRYHAKANCLSLSRSTVGEITLEEAARLGYTPCTRCNPPAPDFDVEATPRPESSGSSSSSSHSHVPSPSPTPYVRTTYEPIPTWEIPEIPTFEPIPSYFPSSGYVSPSYSSAHENSRSAAGSYHSSSKGSVNYFGVFFFFVVMILGYWGLYKLFPTEKRKKSPVYVPKDQMQIIDRNDLQGPDDSNQEFEDRLNTLLEKLEKKPTELPSLNSPQIASADERPETIEFSPSPEIRESKKSEPPSPMPENCFIGEDGLPACKDGPERWGEGYTFYMTASGRMYHTRYCKVGLRSPFHAVNAYTAKKGFRYYDGPHYYKPCSYCKPVLPDLTWYEKARKNNGVKANKR